MTRLWAAAVLVVAVAAGCSSAGAPSTSSLNIVVGENFWGSLASQLAGKAADVTSVVTDPNVDPHDYQANSDIARAFATADYVVLNGAGYDAWAGKLLLGNPNRRRKVLTIATLLGKKAGDNPHFWYSPDFVGQVINRMAADLISLAPAETDYFDAQRTALGSQMSAYRNRLSSIKAKYAGVPVASTESIFVYLAQYLGLNLISPPEFMQAVAEGNDPTAASVAQFQSLISARQAKVLVYDKQTSTAVTTNIKKLAAAAGIPVVGVTETVQPADATFEQWFEAELEQLQNALAGP